MDLLLKSLTHKDVDKIPVFPVDLNRHCETYLESRTPGWRKGLEDALETLKTKQIFSWKWREEKHEKNKCLFPIV